MNAGVVQVDAEFNSTTGRGWLVAPKPSGYDGVLVTLDPKGNTSELPAGQIILSADYAGTEANFIRCVRLAPKPEGSKPVSSS